ncbi:hypothetical protein DMENIID0001_008630 [Sergentomyia squamirostris]
MRFLIILAFVAFLSSAALGGYIIDLTVDCCNKGISGDVLLGALRPRPETTTPKNKTPENASTENIPPKRESDEQNA